MSMRSLSREIVLYKLHSYIVCNGAMGEYISLMDCLSWLRNIL